MSNLFENDQFDQLQVAKSELLFLYESTFSIPNGDPFTGEQRLDEETKRILVSDVRIKRFVRDFLYDTGRDIYVRNDRSNIKGEGDAESGAAARFNTLEAAAKKAGKAKATAQEILTELIDVRLFGGISTKKGNAVNLTGPVQFALLNPSLNKVDLRMHQNTSVFASSTDKGRGAIGTTTVVPYALCQIHGWINPFVALQTGLSEADIDLLLKAMWHSINLANTRTKSNQNSRLLLQVLYANPTRKIYGLDNKIELQCGTRDGQSLREEQLRSSREYSLSFEPLFDAIDKAGDIVEKVRYYTEDDVIDSLLADRQKFEKLTF